LSFDFARMSLSWETDVRCVILIVVRCIEAGVIINEKSEGGRSRVPGVVLFWNFALLSFDAFLLRWQAAASLEYRSNSWISRPRDYIISVSVFCARYTNPRSTITTDSIHPSRQSNYSTSSPTTSTPSLPHPTTPANGFYSTLPTASSSLSSASHV